MPVEPHRDESLRDESFDRDDVGQDGEFENGGDVLPADNTALGRGFSVIDNGAGDPSRTADSRWIP